MEKMGLLCLEDGKPSIVEYVSPTQPNGYKFELLVLDMIHMMDNNLAYEVVREKEFAPIKNLHGVDSVDSARELLKGNGIEL
ncbi:hypothetical protein [Treponema bryantii]|uniref:hypothetical protein n=1 Tax=Treponema bryantii TaxID=163 RepID=UPI001C4338B8|nr:hypothetical protein [Treponema bryantii]